MAKATWRGLLAHKLRLALATMAIVLGVSFVTGTVVLGDTINHTFDQLFQNVDAGIDVQVRGVSTGTDPFGGDIHPPIPASTVDTVRQVDGVKEAFGALARTSVIIGRDGSAIINGGAPTLALLYNPYPDMSPYTLRSGNPPQGSDQVLIDAHTAATQHWKPGDRIKVILSKGGPQSFTVSGVTGFGDQDTLVGATVTAFDPQYGPAIMGVSNEFDQIEVKAQQGITAEQLKARVSAALPAGIEAVTGQSAAAEASSAVKKNISFLTTFLLVFAFISVFVGSFIILNTFSILVAQRTRELALLRCLGATRRQVMGMVLSESLLTGLIASAIGIVVGLGIAKGLEALLASVGLDLSGTSLQLQPRTVLVGFLVGTLVTITAATLPARRATRVAPVEALREATPQVSAVSLKRIVGGGALVALGIVAILVGLFAVSSNQLLLAGIGALLSILGVTVLAPIVVVPVISTLGAPVRRWRGVPGKLARENAMRQPRRTAATAAALMIGVAVVACFTVVAASLTDSVNKVIDRTVTADYIISPQNQGGGQALISTEVSNRLAADNHIAVVSPISAGFFHYGSELDQAEAVEPSTILKVSDIVVQKGVALDRLGDSDVAISEDVAKNHSVRVGDTLPMQFARPGVHQQRVSTIYARNPLFGDYVVTRSLWQTVNITTNDVVVPVKGAPGVSQSDLRSDIRSDISDFPNLKIENNAEYKKSQDQQVNVLLNLLSALVLLAIVIALLGVVNTMALAIVERVRELGLVRALGMTRPQTRSMVRWETVLITVFGALLGCVVGICFGVALVRAFASQGVDVINIALPQQITYVVYAFFAGLAAAIWPARRAARVDMLQAIATE